VEPIEHCAHYGYFFKPQIFANLSRLYSRSQRLVGDAHLRSSASNKENTWICILKSEIVLTSIFLRLVPIAQYIWIPRRSEEWQRWVSWIKAHMLTEDSIHNHQLLASCLRKKHRSRPALIGHPEINRWAPLQQVVSTYTSPKRYRWTPPSMGGAHRTLRTLWLFFKPQIFANLSRLYSRSQRLVGDFLHRSSASRIWLLSFEHLEMKLIYYPSS